MTACAQIKWEVGELGYMKMVPTRKSYNGSGQSIGL